MDSMTETDKLGESAVMTEARLRQLELVAADIVEALHEERIADGFAHVVAAERNGQGRALVFLFAGLLAVQEYAEETVALWRGHARADGGS